MNHDYNKWHSRRFWMVVWAAMLTSLIVVLERIEFLEIARALVVVIGVWVGGESYLKKVFKKEE